MRERQQSLRHFALIFRQVVADLWHKGPAIRRQQPNSKLRRCIPKLAWFCFQPSHTTLQAGGGTSRRSSGRGNGYGSMTTPYQLSCAECGRSYAKENTLWRHILTVHNPVLHRNCEYFVEMVVLFVLHLLLGCVSAFSQTQPCDKYLKGHWNYNQTDQHWWAPCSIRCSLLHKRLPSEENSKSEKCAAYLLDWKYNV